jgi:dipeptidyl aminopeptidase/acylaminoacyl peptidase
MLMNPDGSGQSVVTSAANESISSPSWSPDSKSIAFAKAGSVWSVLKTGANLTRLTTPGTNESDGGVQWAPSGDRIGYVHYAPLTGGGFSYTLKIIGTAGAVLHSESDVFGGFAWSPDGGRIAYSGSGVFVMDANGARKTRVYADESSGMSWANPNRSNRKMVGPSAEMTASATGFVYGASSGGRATDTPASLFAFDSASAASAFTASLPPEMNPGTNIVYRLESLAAADSMRTLVYWNFSQNDPVAVPFDTPVNGAIVTFNSSTGEISSVAVFATPARSAGSKSPQGKAENGGLSIQGSFKGVWDQRGKNIAPQGASEIRYDATGRILSAR